MKQKTKDTNERFLILNILFFRKSPIEAEDDSWWEWKHVSLDKCEYHCKQEIDNQEVIWGTAGS